jgi:acetate kinase
MGTRSGDIDPSIIFHLINHYDYKADEINNLLNKSSGMFGLTGFSDMRDINQAQQQGDTEAELALDMYAYRIKKYIGAYAAALNGLDAIIFTAGVGENDAATRLRICSAMNYLGLQINKDLNKERAPGIKEINTVDSPVKILIVPTNEELEIVKQCYHLLAKT